MFCSFVNIYGCYFLGFNQTDLAFYTNINNEQHKHENSTDNVVVM